MIHLKSGCFILVAESETKSGVFYYERKPHTADMRKYYMTHLPYGMTRKDIEKMDDFDLKRMSDILSE